MSVRSRVLKKFVKGDFLFSMLIFLSVGIANAQIRVNQVGYYTHGEKIGVGISMGAGSFELIDVSNGTSVFTGTLGAARTWPQSGESARVLDFSSFQTPGSYKLKVGGTESFVFKIKDDIMNPVLKGVLRSYFYNRASTSNKTGKMLLNATVAGDWVRQGGHPDNQVLVHSSAASAARPEGTVISCPRGWYDAGDYNKYVVNSGITTYSILAAYENYHQLFDTLNTNIWESFSGGVPDILDEAVWNLRWLLTMQDPNDGGVYHKLTTKNFSGDNNMPSGLNDTRYVVQKTSTATYDLAAVMAQAYRIFQHHEATFPGLADSCLQAAKAAWVWGNANH